MTMIVALLLWAATLQQPCGTYEMTARQVDGGYVMDISACPADIAALGTAEELGRVVDSPVAAHNYFLILYGRRYGVTLVPLSE